MLRKKIGPSRKKNWKLKKLNEKSAKKIGKSEKYKIGKKTSLLKVAKNLENLKNWQKLLATFANIPTPATTQQPISADIIWPRDAMQFWIKYCKYLYVWTMKIDSCCAHISENLTGKT